MAVLIQELAVILDGRLIGEKKEMKRNGRKKQALPSFLSA